MKAKYPIINLEKTDLSENYFSDKDGNTFDVPTIIQYCKEQKFPIFNAPIASINIDYLAWEINDTYDFCYHINRVNSTNLKYPIILSPNGQIVDGVHRVCKAIILGNKTIKCIRMQSMPKISGKIDTKND